MDLRKSADFVLEVQEKCVKLIYSSWALIEIYRKVSSWFFETETRFWFSFNFWFLNCQNASITSMCTYLKLKSSTFDSSNKYWTLWVFLTMPRPHYEYCNFKLLYFLSFIDIPNSVSSPKTWMPASSSLSHSSLIYIDLLCALWFIWYILLSPLQGVSSFFPTYRDQSTRLPTNLRNCKLCDYCSVSIIYS